MTIEYKPLQSSNVAAAAYDPEKRTMRIRFTNGSEYEYEGVPEDVFSGLFTAPSVGSYFAAAIKGRYPFQKVVSDALV